MVLAVIANYTDITKAINEFNRQYHQDYFAVSQLSKQFLEENTEDNARFLADELRSVLCNWGAGKREAPRAKTVNELRALLLKDEFYSALKAFSKWSIASLGILDANRVISGDAYIADFDRELYNLLHQISIGFLEGNTNVTYPMKVLLLLTGFMPALDGQVRRGLGKVGFSGVNVTQFLMPPSIESTPARKISRLPFYFADCYARNIELFQSAIKDSKYPQLSNELGRLFDVLLFVQGSTELNIFTLSPANRNWYGLQ